MTLHKKLSKLHTEVSKYFNIEPGYEVKESSANGITFHYVSYQVVGEKKGYGVNVTYMNEYAGSVLEEFDYEKMLFDVISLAHREGKIEDVRRQAKANQ